MKRGTVITRIIASLILASFVAQDVVWADPDALGASGNGHSLQIESKLKPFTTETFLKNRLEISLKLIIQAISNDMPNFKLKIVCPISDTSAKLIYDFNNKYREGDKWVVPCMVIDEGRNYTRTYEAVIGGSADAGIAFREREAAVSAAQDTDALSKIRGFARSYDQKGLVSYILGFDPKTDRVGCDAMADAALAASYDLEKSPCCISHIATKAIAEACRQNPALMEVFAGRIAIALDKAPYKGIHALAEVILGLTRVSFEHKGNNIIELLASRFRDDAKLVRALKAAFEQDHDLAHSKWLPALPGMDADLGGGIGLKAINRNSYIVEKSGVAAGVVEAYDAPQVREKRVTADIFKESASGDIGVSVMKWAASKMEAGQAIARPYPADERSLALFFRCVESGIFTTVSVIASEANDIEALRGIEPAWVRVYSVRDALKYKEAGKNIFVRGVIAGKPQDKALTTRINKPGTSFNDILKKLFPGIQGIKFRNPVVFAQLAGFGGPVPVGWQSPIVVMQEDHREGTIRYDFGAEQKAVAADTSNVVHIDLGSGDDDNAINNEYQPGLVASSEVAKLIDPIKTPAERLNTPEEVMEILKTGYEEHQLLEDGKSRSTVLPRNWALRSHELLSEDLKAPSPYALVSPLEESLLRERIAVALKPKEDGTPSPLLHMLNTTIAGLCGSHNVRAYIGSKTGYFQVKDINEKFRHQFDIVFVVEGDFPMRNMMVNENFKREMLGILGKDIFDSLDTRVVGAETLRKAFTEEETLAIDEARIKDRAELQALFVSLYRTHFPAAGRGIIIDANVAPQAMGTFCQHMTTFEDHYAMHRAKELSALLKDIEKYKAKKKAFKEVAATQDLAEELTQLRNEMESINKTIKRYATIRSENARKQLLRERERIEALRASYSSLSREEKEAYKRAIETFNEKNSELKTAISKMPNLLTQRDMIQTEIDQKEEEMQRNSADYMEIDNQQNKAARMRDYIYQEMEDCLGNSALVPGTIIGGKYLITDFRGSGGFGMVYGAKDITYASRDVEVALKFIWPAKPGILTSYESELAIYSKARFRRAPIPVFKGDKGSYGKYLYFVMSLEKGRSLGSIFSDIKSGKLKLSMEKKLILMYAIAKIVSDLHEKTSLIHRDLKPENIMVHVNSKGELDIPEPPAGVENDPRLAQKLMPAYLDSRKVQEISDQSCIIDLGLSCLGEGTVSKTSGKEIITLSKENQNVLEGGTPVYMAPEHILGKESDISDLSDVYSLGVIFYRMLTGGSNPIDRPGEPTIKDIRQMYIAKSEKALTWPNVAIANRKIAEADIKRLLSIHPQLLRGLIEANMILDSNGKVLEWHERLTQKVLSEAKCRWNNDIAGNRKRLELALGKISVIGGLSEEKRDEIISIIAKEEIPDLVAALVMQMLDKTPENRPSVNLAAKELRKLLCGGSVDELLYVPKRLQKGKMARAIASFKKHPFLATAIIAVAAVGYSGYLQYIYRGISDKDRLTAEDRRRNEADAAAELKRVKEEAVKEGITDLSGTQDDIRKRIWGKKEADNKAKEDAIAAQKAAAEKEIKSRQAEKARIEEEIAAAIKRSADAQKNGLNAESARKAVEQVNKELADLNRRRAAVEKELKAAEEKLRTTVSDLEQEVARKRAEKAAIEADLARARAATDKAKAELEHIFLQREAASLGLDTSGSSSELRARIEAKKRLQPSYIVSYLENGKPDWLLRIAFSFWSVPHEIGNFIQAAVTGRINDIKSISLKNLFYGWEYKGRAPPCIGGAIANLLVGGILLNYFSASPYSVVYNIFNLIFIGIEIAAMIKLFADKFSSLNIGFRSLGVMAVTTAGIKVPAALQMPVFFMKTKPAEVPEEEKPDFIPGTGYEYARGFIRDFILSLEHVALSGPQDEVENSVTKVFHGISMRDPRGWAQPYLMFEGKTAILVFRDGPDTSGLGSKTFGYRIPLNKASIKRLEVFVTSTYRAAALDETFMRPSEYLGELRRQERVALAARAMERSTHLDLEHAIYLATTFSQLAGASIPDESDPAVKNVFKLTAEAVNSLLALREGLIKFADFHKMYKAFSPARTEAAYDDIKNAFVALKAASYEWKKSAEAISAFKGKHPGRIAEDVNALESSMDDLMDIIAVDIDLIEAKSSPSTGSKGAAELIDTVMAKAGRMDRKIEVTMAGQDELKLYAVNGNWRPLAAAIENAIFNAARSSSDTDGPIQLNAKLLCVDGQDYIEVTVRDRGKGIKPGDLFKIADPGYALVRISTGWPFAKRAIEDAGGNLSISSKTEGPEKGTLVSIQWPVRKTAAARAPAAKKAPVVDIRFLRDMKRLDEVSRNMVEGILSLSLSKKVVIAFDDKLGGLQSRTILSVFNELEDLKSDPKFEKILKNLRIVVASPERLASEVREFKEQGCEVFMFARTTERQTLAQAENASRATYIDEAAFPLYESDAYYPLAEIVTVSLAQALDPLSLDQLTTALKDMNIKPAVKDGIYIFTLLPPSERFDPQELLQRYARLKECLKSA